MLGKRLDKRLGTRLGAAAAFAIVVLASAIVAAPSPADEKMMRNTDLFGSDFSSLIARNEFTCLQACSANEQCRAWTFVKQGSKCFLKSAVPARSTNRCCVSGVKEAVLMPTPGEPLPVPPPLPQGALSCLVALPVDVCADTNGCGEGTDVEPIGVLQKMDTVTIISAKGAWHEVRVPGGLQGWVYSGADYRSLECK